MKVSDIKSQAAAFKTRTDNLFAAARGNANLTTEELLESLPELTKDIATDDLVAGLGMLGLQGVDLLSPEQTRHGVAVASGKVKPNKLLTPEELLSIAFKHSNGNKSTQSSRIAALTAFMSFCKVVSPLSCTRTQAEDFLAHELDRGLAKGTVKTAIHNLSSCWTALLKERQYKNREHIFKGLAGSHLLKPTPTEVMRRDQELISFVINPIESWSDSNHKYTDIYRILYYTGCRISEIAALRAEDILADCINVFEHDDRGLKNVNSQRQIPIHPKLEPILAKYRQQSGILWPALRDEDKNGRVRWGHNLSKPCKQITGVSPHKLRHNVNRILVENDVSERTCENLLGHATKKTNRLYGGNNWTKKVEAINYIN